MANSINIQHTILDSWMGSGEVRHWGHCAPVLVIYRGPMRRESYGKKDQADGISAGDRSGASVLEALIHKPKVSPTSRKNALGPNVLDYNLLQCQWSSAA
jgi:hypothetical protein